MTPQLKTTSRNIVATLLLAAALTAGCAPSAQSGPTPTLNAATESPAYWPTEGWRTSTPEEQGVDSETLAEMFETIQEQD